MYKKIEGVLKRIKNDLDSVNSEKPDNINIITLYGYNGSGKTRLSKSFVEKYNDKVLCYNAFLEDFFSWDNKSSILKIETNSWVFELIEKQELDGKISDNFKDFTNSKIEPKIDFQTGDVYFNLPTGDEDSRNNIKISRGEESIFIWSVFYTIVKAAIDMLDEELRSEHIFDNIKYIIIDDPVSSMDDSRIITVALKIINLIYDSKKKFSFLVTTHHPLFFNVLFNKKDKNWNKKHYILNKINTGFHLKNQGNESPFAYHHLIMENIKTAANSQDLKKHHFNLFRALLEKTANFLGYKHWKDCLIGIEVEDDFIKIIDHYSHDRLSDLEYNDLIEKETETFKEVYKYFIKKYYWKEDTDVQS